MLRREAISIGLAGAAVLAAPRMLLAQPAPGSGFESFLRACISNSLSAMDRVQALLNDGWQPVGNLMDDAVTVVSDSMSVMPFPTLSEGYLSRRFRHQTRVNTDRNLRRASTGSVTSRTLFFEEPTGKIFASVLQGQPGARIICSAGATASETAVAFLGKYIDPVPPIPPEDGFVRTELRKQDKTRTAIATRITLTRISPQIIGTSLGAPIQAFANLLITSSPAR